jgi:hypothetical protein
MVGILMVLGIAVVGASTAAAGTITVRYQGQLATPPQVCDSLEETAPNPGNWYHVDTFSDYGAPGVDLGDSFELNFGGNADWYWVHSAWETGGFAYMQISPTPYLIFISPDQYEYQPWVDPDPSEMFDIYVIVDCFGLPPTDGTRGTGVLFERTFQGFKLGQTNLMGGLDFGDVEVDGSGSLCIGVVQYLYLGPGGYVQLLPHPGTGKDIIDCDFNSNTYCISGNVGVWDDPPLGEEGCDCVEPSPVEPTTWGGIKALYR